ncbi:hypothetical protein E2P81_ATG12093 [Venturia nashicola]|nr:hypothetical protein E2P81_ATG12093 [Venturia nashicola]
MSFDGWGSASQYLGIPFHMIYGTPKSHGSCSPAVINSDLARTTLARLLSQQAQLLSDYSYSNLPRSQNNRQSEEAIRARKPSERGNHQSEEAVRARKPSERGSHQSEAREISSSKFFLLFLSPAHFYNCRILISLLLQQSASRSQNKLHFTSSTNDDFPHFEEATAALQAHTHTLSTATPVLYTHTLSKAQLQTPQTVSMNRLSLNVTSSAASAAAKTDASASRTKSQRAPAASAPRAPLLRAVPAPAAAPAPAERIMIDLRPRNMRRKLKVTLNNYPKPGILRKVVLVVGGRLPDRHSPIARRIRARNAARRTAALNAAPRQQRLMVRARQQRLTINLFRRTFVNVPLSFGTAQQIALSLRRIMRERGATIAARTFRLTSVLDTQESFLKLITRRMRDIVPLQQNDDKIRLIEIELEIRRLQRESEVLVQRASAQAL